MSNIDIDKSCAYYLKYFKDINDIPKEKCSENNKYQFIDYKKSEILKICESHCDEDYIDFEELRKMIYNLELKNAVDNIDCDKEIRVLKKIQQKIGNTTKLPNLEKEKIWKDLLTYAMEIYSVDSTLYSDDIPDYEQQMQIKSIKFLRSNKFNVGIENARISISEETDIKINNDIGKLISDIGGKNVIDSIFERYLDKYYYNAELQRYIITRAKYTCITKEIVPQVPFNYIIQMSLKYLRINNHQNRNSRKFNKTLDKIIKIASAYTVCLNIQKFSFYHDINIYYKDLPYYFLDNLLYDKLFPIRQWNKKYAKNILVDLYGKYFENINNAGYTFEEYIKVFDLFLESSEVNKIYKKDEILNKLKFSNKEHIENILNDISQESYKVNESFKDINGKFNFYEKPLIKLNDQYFIIHPSIVAYSFLEVIYKKIKKSYRLLDRKLGIDLEEHIKEKLTSKGYDFKYGGYKYENGTTEDYECDLIIENKEEIIFIEIKKRPLDEQVFEGDDVRYYVSLADSLMHSQLQAGYHSIQIKNKNKIELYERVNNVTNYDKKIGEINYCDRRIIRMSLVLGEYGFITNKIIVEQFLDSIQNININTINSDRQIELKKFEKVQNKLRDQKDLLSPNARKIYFNSIFRTYQQFMYILDKSNTIDEFMNGLICDLNISYGSQDFYSEWLQHEKMNI